MAIVRGMRRRWTIEAEYPDGTRASAVDSQLQALLDLYTAGRARILEAVAIEAQDPAPVPDGVEADVLPCEVVRPVLRLVASS